MLTGSAPVAEQFTSFSQEHVAFIEAQQMFFVATAAPEGRVNVSPKGQESLRVLGPNEIVWLNLTGSGNESAAHVRASGRITLMWCAFAGPPRILRVYGSAEAVHPRHPLWSRYADLISPPVGARQYFRVDVDLVQTSCGYAVPLYQYQEQRKALTLWAEKRGPEGIAEYWSERNVRSIDGFPTGVIDED